MGYECIVKVVDADGKEVKRFPTTLYRSYTVGEKTWGIARKSIRYEVMEGVTLTVKEIEEELPY